MRLSKSLWLILFFAMALTGCDLFDDNEKEINTNSTTSTGIGGNGGGGTSGNSTVVLISGSYAAGGTMPAATLCAGNSGSNQSPQFSWSAAPTGTTSYAIIIDDETSPCGTGDDACLHWGVFNIPSTTTSLAANENVTAISGVVEGTNYLSAIDYAGPCANEDHTYKTTIYAMASSMPAIASGATFTRSQFASSFSDHILSYATISGVAGAGGVDVQADSIVLTKGYDDVITDLDGGMYEAWCWAHVSDQLGRSVPDGTVVNLTIIDSIIASSATGHVAGEDKLFADTNATFETTTIVRNHTNRPIAPSDNIFIFEGEQENRVRVVSSINSGTNISVTEAYEDDVDANDNSLSYKIGASEFSSRIFGEDANGNRIAGKTITSGGKAKFFYQYPADTAHLKIGLLGADDGRGDYATSAQVYIAANSGEATTISADNQFGFFYIAGGTIEAGVSAVSAGLESSFFIGLTLRDGGERVPVPFAGIGWVLDGDLPVNITMPDIGVGSDAGLVTGTLGVGQKGTATVIITLTGGAADDEVKITFYSTEDSSATTTITVTAI